MLISFITGIILILSTKNVSIRKIGWGIFYGSVTSICLIVGFLIWFANKMH